MKKQTVTEPITETYRDRAHAAQLAAAFAHQMGYTVGWGEDPEYPDWPVLYIDLPTGQVSWHIAEKDVLPGLPVYFGEWDGSDDKPDRIEAFVGGGDDAD